MTMHDFNEFLNQHGWPVFFSVALMVAVWKTGRGMAPYIVSLTDSHIELVASMKISNEQNAAAIQQLVGHNDRNSSAIQKLAEAVARFADSHPGTPITSTTHRHL